MPKPAKRPATYDDLLKVPDNLVAEIVEGELFTSPRPGSPHAAAASVLGARILTNFHGGGGGGGWWILDEPELHLGPDVLVPDIAGWRHERMPVIPRAASFDLAPDWVCEVVSPSTGRLDRVRKLPAYARREVRHAWLVDPEQQTLEVYRLENARWVLVASHEGEDVVRVEPFEAIELPLATLWLPTS
ncbi:MAG TPA: Uma2 family endonuclease [Thermoanaerobaculia bacterium]